QPESKALVSAGDSDNIYATIEADPMEEIQSAGHKLLPGSRVSTRRKRNIDDFWSSSIHGNQPHSSSAKTAPTAMPGPVVIDSTLANDSKVCSESIGQDKNKQEQATSSDAHVSDEVYDKHSVNKALIESVSLVKHKSRSKLHQIDILDTTPNFKRFKKTVHPYQLV
ncbi:hypothetical protein IWW36_003500, partial [Coemansia brasiliensis]